MTSEPGTTDTARPAGAADRFFERLATTAIAIAGIALVGLVVVQAWQVFTRYVLNDSPPWTMPVTLLLLSIAMSMGAAAGVHGNRHFGFFLLADMLRPGARRVVDVIVCLIVAGIGAVLAQGGWTLWVDGLHIPTAGAPMPESIGYLPLSIGGGLMTVFALHRLSRALTATAADRRH